MSRKVFSHFALTLILTALPACDNVEWEGVAVELEPPGSPSRWEAMPAPREGSVEEEIPREPIDLGPVLYLVERSGPEAHALPVAVLEGDGYAALPDESEVPDLEERFGPEVLREGTELVLFHEGRRVGTFLAGEAAAPDTTYCRARPRVEGGLELRPGAGGADRMLALAKSEHGSFPHGLYGPLDETPEDVSTSTTVANWLIATVEAPWPPSVPEMRKDLEVFPLGAESRRTLAASFIYGDELQVGEPSDLAYSLFYVATPEEETGQTRPFWYWYQREDEGGKAWPELVGSLDWRGDGSEDLLLRVFGRESTWFAVLGRRGASWRLLYQEPCTADVETGLTGTNP